MLTFAIFKIVSSLALMDNVRCAEGVGNWRQLEHLLCGVCGQAVYVLFLRNRLYDLFLAAALFSLKKGILCRVLNVGLMMLVPFVERICLH